MKAVLLLHGFLTDHTDFKALIPGLKKMYDNVCIYVFPGHLGLDGTLPDYKKFTLEETFRTVNETMQDLLDKYEIVDVIGFSMGGAIATYLASKYSFRNLVLLSPANKYLNFSLPINRFAYFMRSVLERSNSKKLTKEQRAAIDEQMESVRIDDVRSINIAFKQLIPNYNFHTLSTFIRIINECNRHLKLISNPTLIIWGELDQLVPKKSINDISKLVNTEKKKYIIYPDISHLMLASKKSYKIVEDILDFLED